MYFLIRDHDYVDLTVPPGITFRQYMERGWNGQRATLEDWANHLTTIFTEVRLKKYVEIRTADSQPPALMLALPALLKGMLYDDDCLGAAWDLVKRLELSRTDRNHRACASGSASRPAPAGPRLRNRPSNCSRSRRRGLVRQRALNERGEDESIYLLAADGPGPRRPLARRACDQRDGRGAGITTSGGWSKARRISGRRRFCSKRKRCRWNSGSPSVIWSRMNFLLIAGNRLFRRACGQRVRLAPEYPATNPRRSRRPRRQNVMTARLRT